jgi:hypothetical protein
VHGRVFQDIVTIAQAALVLFSQIDIFGEASLQSTIAFLKCSKKVKEAKQSENEKRFYAKISEYCEKKEAKTSKRTSETHAKRISVRFVLL